MARYIKSIIMIIILLFLVTFGVKNSQPIQIYYYLNFHTGAFPLYGLVYLCIVIGIVIGMMVGIYDRIDLRRRVKRLERENRELKEKAEEEEQEGEALSGPIPVEQRLADERLLDDRGEK
ncbi:MAG: LapA family protein [Deltaproteobacteria bacterium]|nr:MAG: LapA family protein [Deltaproteobacteria bacterium]